MAAAGPAGNLLIAIVVLVILRIGLAADWFIAPDQVSFDSIVELAGGGGPSFVTTLLSIFIVMNVFLCVDGASGRRYATFATARQIPRRLHAAA